MTRVTCHDARALAMTDDVRLSDAACFDLHASRWRHFTRRCYGNRPDARTCRNVSISDTVSRMRIGGERTFVNFNYCTESDVSINTFAIFCLMFKADSGNP